VLEVDDHGRPTVVARYRDGPDAPDGLRELLTAPKLTARAEDTLARLVEYGSRVCGYRFDRQARRRLRERLVAGETEEQIRAVWDRTRAALEREPEEPDELDQALRLAGA
jgi:hypothetical protein